MSDPVCLVAVVSWSPNHRDLREVDDRPGDPARAGVNSPGLGTSEDQAHVGPGSAADPELGDRERRRRPATGQGGP